MMIVMMSNNDFPDIGYPHLLLRSPAIISSIFLKMKSCQLTKVLANAKVDGQRLGQKSKSILDMMQFDTKVHIKEMLRFFAMFGFISNSNINLFCEVCQNVPESNADN